MQEVWVRVDRLKLLTRDEFRKAVFKRDDYLCVFCQKPAADAHHIMERRLFPDGGYYLDNGASVCPDCHLDCEKTVLAVETVRSAAGITHVILPPHLYTDQIYDKWGNPVLSNGQRMKGELFDDENVQKVLKDVLHLFTDRVKYPRTHHLPWSPGMTDDDRRIPTLDDLSGHDVVVTEKMDGEQTTMYSDGIHARSIDGRNHPSRDWVKAVQARISGDLPKGFRVCGENLRAEHSIPYKELETYFMVFSIWSGLTCLSWKETKEWADLLDLRTVPVLYEGPWDLNRIKQFDLRDWNTHEGYVIRRADAFTHRQHRTHVAKFVRKGHVQTSKHWMQGQFTPNELKI